MLSLIRHLHTIPAGVALACLPFVAITGCKPRDTPVVQVNDPNRVILRAGEPISLLIPQNAAPHERDAATLLANFLEGALGVRPTIATEGTQADGFPIHIGDTAAARDRGLGNSAFSGEAYAVAISSDDVILNGIALRGGFNTAHDRYQGQPLLWAVNTFADRHLGVRWLWPGAFGTYSPKHKEIALPIGIIRDEPQFLIRRHRIPKAVATGVIGDHAAVRQWLEACQVGQRGEIPFAHAFTRWWAKFGEQQPGFFALPPKGYKQPWPKPELVKLRLANPGVAQQILADYKAAGAPPYWNIAPNDSIGFDTSEETQAWDRPRASTAEALWLGETMLTPRYVRFWNEIYSQLSSLNPDVYLCTILYSRYRTPPPPEVELKARMVLATVDTPIAYDEWRQWRGKANRMILRPNWWHSGANAPELPVTREGKFIEFARANGLVGYDFDTLIGYWGTQGLRYYVTARLLARPDYTTEQAVEDYLSAFGSASQSVGEYFALWEKKSEAAAYTIDVGGPGSINPDGEFEQLARRLGHSGHPISGSYRVMPELYSEALISKAESLLAKAMSSAKGDPVVEGRINFLRDGLREFELTREVLRLGYRLRSGKNGQEETDAFLAKAAELRAFRESLDARGVIWSPVLYQREKVYKAPTTAAEVKAAEPDLRGM